MPVHSDHKTSLNRTVLLATDSKNSVLAELAAETIHAIAYSAYGHQSSLHAAMSTIGFNGALREAFNGWYLLGNGYRAYNPGLMCFHRPDSLSPFGAGGINCYAYCSNEPVGSTDPTGHVRVTRLIPTRALPYRPNVNVKNPKVATATPVTSVAESGLEKHTQSAISTPLASQQSRPSAIVERPTVTRSDNSSLLNNADTVRAEPPPPTEMPVLKSQIDPWFQPRPQGKRKKPILVAYGSNSVDSERLTLVVSIKKIRLRT
jgi:RHS repeat-associated protein